MPRTTAIVVSIVVTVLVGCSEPDLGITELSAVRITTESLDPGQVGVLYADTLEAVGGAGAYTWLVTAGTLPEGLALQDSAGVVSGVPTRADTLSVTIRATSWSDQRGSAQFTVAIGPPPVLLPSDRCSSHSDFAIASFADPRLDSLVRGELGVPEDTHLACGDLAEVDTIVVLDVGMTTLEGVENLTGLDYFGLALDTVPEIARLAEIPGLTHLNLFRTPVPDVSWMQPIEGLSVLWLRYTGTTDLTGLESLENLTAFLSSENGLSSLGPLADLSALTTLELREEPSVTDITPLSDLLDLSELYLRSTGVDQGDLNLIADLGSLTELAVTGSGLSDPAPLVDLSLLTHLDLSSNPLSDASSIGAMSSLRALRLEDIGLTDVGWLASLSGLVELRLGLNAVSDISALAGLTALEVLDLSENPLLSDLTAIQDMSALSSLHLTDLPVLTDLQPLLDNPGLGSGDLIRLWGSDAVSCDDVAQLRARGAIVESGTCP